MVTQSAGALWLLPSRGCSPHDESLVGLLPWLGGAQELRFPHVPLAAKSSPINASYHGSQHHYFSHNRNKKKKDKSLLRRA